MRLPYAPATAPDDAATPAYTAIAARRAPRPLQPLDRALLHSPPVAQGWSAFLGAVRTQTTLAADARELAVCRVAALNRAPYEWHHHAPLARAAGVSAAGLRKARDAPCRVAADRASGEGGAPLAPAPAEQAPDDLAPRLRAVLDYTDQMTRGVRVEEAVFAEVRQHYSERETVELTATVAAYNCVSRFLVALDVGESNDVLMEVPE